MSTKKAYVYEDLGQLTTSWHDGGGLFIVTDGDPAEAWRARNEDIARGHPSNRVYLDPKVIRQDLPAPDYIYTVQDDAPNVVIVFPDQGCC